MLDIHTAEFLDAVSDALAIDPGPHPVADFLLVRGLRRRTNVVREALTLVQRDGDVERALELLDRALSEEPVLPRVSACDLIDPGPTGPGSTGCLRATDPGSSSPRPGDGMVPPPRGCTDNC